MRVLLFFISFGVLGFTLSAQAAPPDPKQDPNLAFDSSTEDARGKERTAAVFQLDPKQPMKDCSGASNGSVCPQYITDGRASDYPTQEFAAAGVAPSNPGGAVDRAPNPTRPGQ